MSENLKTFLILAGIVLVLVLAADYERNKWTEFDQTVYESMMAETAPTRP